MADPISDPLAWRAAKAPSLAEFEILAGEVFRHLPKRFRDLAADVVIRVDDFPSEDVLDEMKAESEFDLLGLFHGVGLPFRSESAAVSRDLPMPGSPEISATRPSPLFAC